MQVSYIIYHSGTGGNFLTRVCTLDPNTVALGQGKYQHLSLEERLAQYTYLDTNLPKLPVKNKDTITWWNWELKNKLPMTRLGVEQCLSLNLHLVESHHHYNIEQHMQNVYGKDDNITFAYVDTTGAEDWYIRQAKQKTGCSNLSNNEILYKLAKENQELFDQFPKYVTNPISLKNIISSEESFIKEYKKMCSLFNLTNYNNQARQLYQQWITTWG
jgi:hypothetical protein